MAEALCRVCAISAARVLRKTDAGTIAVPAQTVRPGHIMVVSATHAHSFSDLKPVEADALMALVAAAARAAEQASGAERYYVLRIGDKAPHLHFHLVPRVEGEDSLAPYVFGETGWSGQIRPDATPPVELFEQALSQMLRLETMTHRAKEDAGRLPPWLAGLGISVTAGTAIFLIASPFTTGPLLSALSLGGMLGTTAAVRERMSGRPMRWGSVLAHALLGGAVAFLMIRWLRG